MIEFETKQTMEGKQTIETECLTRLQLGNQTNVRHIVNAANVVTAANSAPLVFENVMPPTRISASRVTLFAFCLLLTQQKRGDSNSKPTS